MLAQWSGRNLIHTGQMAASAIGRCWTEQGEKLGGYPVVIWAFDRSSFFYSTGIVIIYGDSGNPWQVLIWTG
mgnify:CR=1 FL=1